MQHTLRLWILGPWQLSIDEGETKRLASRGVRVLLARLVMAHPQPVTRETLLADLFPHLASNVAGNRLRVARYYLRHELGALLVSNSDQLGLDPALAISCDYATFLQKTEHSAALSDLEDAIALYRGPLLDSAPDGWAAEEAQQAHARYGTALRRLAALARAANDPERLAKAARRWASEEPWDEQAHISYLGALIALGERAAAEAHLRHARSLLRAEWGEQTQRAFAELARSIARLAASASHPASLAHPNTPALPLAYAVAGAIDRQMPLIGRAAELEVLTQTWRQAAAGQPRGLLIEGAGGVGKTRLAQELAAQVRLRAHHSVLWLDGRDAAADSWFQLLQAAVHTLAASNGAQIAAACAALDDLTWGVLCRYWPDLQRFDTTRDPIVLPTLPSLADATTRRIVALSALLTQMAHTGALLLVLDHLPPTDPELCRLLEHLLDQQCPLCLVLTRPPDESSGQLLTAGAAWQLILLRPLDADTTRGLITAALGAPADTMLLNRLVELSGGSPSFVLNVVRNLLDQGVLHYDALAGWQCTQPTLSLPQRLSDLLAQRLSRLTPAAHELAALLAVLGRPAEDALLEALCPNEDARVAAQAELLRRAVVVEQGAQLRFDQPGFGTLVQKGLNDAQRAALHYRVAIGLQALPDADTAEQMHHLASAHEWDAALDVALGVAETAVTESRLTLLRRALDVCNQAIRALECDPGEERRWQVLQLRERYRAHAERGPASQSDLDELIAFASASGRVDWQVEALVRSGLAKIQQGSPARAVAMLHQAASLARVAGLHSAEGWARLSLAQALDAQGAVEQALQECIAAAAVALAVEETGLHLRVLMRLGYAHARSGQVAAGMALLDGLQAHPLLCQRPLLALRLSHTLSIVRMGARDYEGALHALRACLQQGQAVGDAYWEVVAQTSLCQVLSRIGMLAESRALGLATLPLARQIGDVGNLVSLLLSLATTLFYAGDAADALPLTREGAALAQRSGLPSEACAHLSLGARIAHTLDNRVEALALVEAASRLGEVASAEDASSAALVWLALGHQGPAQRAARRAISRTRQGGLDAIADGAALWEAANVLAATEGRAAAEPIFCQATAHFLDDLSRLASSELRSALIAARPAHRAIAAHNARDVPQRVIWLPLRAAPTGRPLHPDELAPVVWTVHAPGDPSGEVECRHRQIRRLSAEALEQGAVVTVEALANALAVTTRTIKRDLHALRDSGALITTRGTLLRPNRVPAAPCTAVPA